MSEKPLICQCARIKMTYKGIGNKRQLLSNVHEKIKIKMRLKSTCWNSV